MATVLGLTYTVLGIVGFAVSGFDGFAAPRGDALTIFEVNPLQSLIHLALGWWLVNSGFVGEAPARRAAWSASVVLAALGLTGFVIFSSRPNLNLLSTNTAVDIAHLVSGGVAALCLAAPVRAAKR